MTDAVSSNFVQTKDDAMKIMSARCKVRSDDRIWLKRTYKSNKLHTYNIYRNLTPREQDVVATLDDYPDRLVLKLRSGEVITVRTVMKRFLVSSAQ